MQSSFPRSIWTASLILLALVLTHSIHAANDSPYCNKDIYGQPISVQCIGILARFPILESTVHYFVEQQMRTEPPTAEWSAFKDPRSPAEQQTVVQLPKWISAGRCNVALFSYTNLQSGDKRVVNFSPALAWSDIFSAALRIDRDCFTHNKGGAVVVKDVSGGPGLSLFMWEDGSDFEFLMNHENLLEFPPGMSRDPNVGPSLFSNTTFMKGLQAAKHSLAQGVSALYL